MTPPSAFPDPAAPLSVVKLGGAVAGDAAARAAVWAAVAAMDGPVVLVHGGGPQATALARRLGHEPRIVAGRRVTGDLDLDVALWTMRGELNARLVASARGAGVRAAGVSGADGGLVGVVRRPPRAVDPDGSGQSVETVDFGHVGDVVGVDAALVRALLGGGFVPVVASVCADRAGALYNVNADTVALELAVALGAARLLLVAEAGGVFRDLADPGSRVAALAPPQIRAGVAEGWIAGGMRPKLEVAREALARGVPAVRIVAPGALADPDAGTAIVAAAPESPAAASVPSGPPAAGAPAAGAPAAGAPRVDVLDLHARLVAIPSLSREEREAADVVEAYARAHGGGRVRVERFEDNVWATLGDAGADDVLLLASHLDVVPPSDGHPYPPFTPTVVDGRVFGRGAVDAKASGAAMLAALLGLARDGWAPPGRLVVALTACEEIGSSENGLDRARTHAPTFPTPRAALVGEPTDLRPCLAQKGLLVLRCTARGQTAHAARAHLGRNALTALARDLLAVARLQVGADDPFLGRPTVTATVAEGGTARNVVPDAATFWLDVRSTPGQSHAALTDEIAGHLESEVAVHSARLVPCSTPADARVARAAASALTALGLDAAPFGSPTASDWAFLADVPAVKIGPGDSRLSHTPDEHVAQAEVERAVAVYRGIAEAYFEMRDA